MFVIYIFILTCPTQTESGDGIPCWVETDGSDTADESIDLEHDDDLDERGKDDMIDDEEDEAPDGEEQEEGLYKFNYWFVLQEEILQRMTKQPRKKHWKKRWR